MMDFREVSLTREIEPMEVGTSESNVKTLTGRYEVLVWYDLLTCANAPKANAISNNHDHRQSDLTRVLSEIFALLDIAFLLSLMKLPKK